MATPGAGVLVAGRRKLRSGRSLVYDAAGAAGCCCGGGACGCCDLGNTCGLIGCNPPHTRDVVVACDVPAWTFAMLDITATCCFSAPAPGLVRAVNDVADFILCDEAAVGWINFDSPPLSGFNSCEGVSGHTRTRVTATTGLNLHIGSRSRPDPLPGRRYVFGPKTVTGQIMRLRLEVGVSAVNYNGFGLFSGALAEAYCAIDTGDWCGFVAHAGGSFGGTFPDPPSLDVDFGICRGGEMSFAWAGNAVIPDLCSSPFAIGGRVACAWPTARCGSGSS